MISHDASPSSTQIRFGLMPVGDVTRAYIEILETGDRLFIYMIWQVAARPHPSYCVAFTCRQSCP